MAAKRHDVTEDSLLAELEEARQSALGNAQSGAAVQATMGKARITGHIIDRKEVGKPGDFDSMSEDELRAWLKANAVQTIEQQAMASAESDDRDSVRVSDRDSVRSSSRALPALPGPTHDGPDSMN